MITKTCECCKRPAPQGVDVLPTSIGPVCEICLDLIEAEAAVLAELRK
jgi:hypothetical protein